MAVPATPYLCIGQRLPKSLLAGAISMERLRELEANYRAAVQDEEDGS